MNQLSLQTGHCSRDGNTKPPATTPPFESSESRRVSSSPTHHHPDNFSDIQRVSGGGEREVADSPLLDKVLVVLQTYEAEAQNGIAGDEGEAGGGLGNLVRLRHSITPLSVRGRRRGRANETTPMPAVPDEETVELKKRKLEAEAETQRLQQQLIRQQIINAETEGAILSVKAAMVNQHRGT